MSFDKYMNSIASPRTEGALYKSKDHLIAQRESPSTKICWQFNWCTSGRPTCRASIFAFSTEQTPAEPKKRLKNIFLTIPNKSSWVPFQPDLGHEITLPCIVRIDKAHEVFFEGN